jgi:hypothetical protein
MREALNSNPLVQAAVIGVLLIGAAFFVISTTGGGGEEESGGETEATVSVSGTTASGSATGATPGEAVEGAVEAAEQAAGASLSSALAAVAGAGASTPPLPRPVLAAWHGNRTLVLLFVRDGGIDDRLTKLATAGLAGFPDVSLFVVPAHRISRYAAITEGVGVDRVPALVVVTPKHLKRVVPTASVSYGFQSAESVRQAVIDAGYKGPTVDYHP